MKRSRHRRKNSERSLNSKQKSWKHRPNRLVSSNGNLPLLLKTSQNLTARLRSIAQGRYCKIRLQRTFESVESCERACEGKVRVPPCPDYVKAGVRPVERLACHSTAAAPRRLLRSLPSADSPHSAIISFSYLECELVCDSWSAAVH